MILIIDKSKMHAFAIAEMLRIIGILAYPEVPARALSEICPAYRAVLVMSPDTLADPRDYLERIRSYDKAVPIFAVSDSENDYGMISKVFPKSAKVSEIANEIIAYQSAHGLPKVGEYRFAGIMAEHDSPLVTYYGKRLPITKTETMILRYLMRVYPAPQNAKMIILHAFRQAKSPEETSIRTFIPLLNKKFRNIAGRNLIIHYPHEGYVLLTPEIISEGKIL